MKNKILLSFSLILLFFAVSCTTTSTAQIEHISEYEFSQMTFEKQIQAVFNRYAEYKGTVFMGISGPYQDKEKAYKDAAEKCAEMAAINQALAFASINEILTNEEKDIDSFESFSRAVFDNKQLMKVAEDLEIIDIVWYGGYIGAVVFGRYGNPTVTHLDSTSWSETDWPTAKEGTIAVGGTDNYYYIQDSIEAAAYQAAIQIAETHYATITAIDDSIDMDLDNMIEQSNQFSFNVLKNFRVLEYGYDPKTNRYSALAITD